MSRSFDIWRKCGHKEIIHSRPGVRIDFTGEKQKPCGFCLEKLRTEMRIAAYQRGSRRSGNSMQSW